MLRTLALGSSAWLIACVWPILDATAVASQTVLWAGASLVALLLGAGLVRRRPGWAGAAWCAGFPIGLAASIASRDEARNQHALSPLPLLFLWLLLCGYGAVAARTCRERGPVLPADVTSLEAESWDPPVKAAPAVARVLTVLCVIGAAAITLLAPTLGGPRVLEQAWGDAARAGAVLTAVVGGALGVTVVTVFLGSALRAEPRPVTEPSRRTFQVLASLLLALLGAATYVVVSNH